MPTYTVKKGDTLSAIAQKYNSTYKYGKNVVDAWTKLAEINGLSDPNRIVIGQKLELDPKNAYKAKSKPGATVVFRVFGLQSDTDRTIYAMWAWSRDKVDKYECQWQYATKNGVWFVGSDSDEKHKQSVYSAPSNATKVRIRVRPVSTKHKVRKKKVSYWTAQWSKWKQYNFSSSPPAQPSAPTVTLDEKNKLKLTAELTNIDTDYTGKQIEFQVVRDDKSYFKSGKSNIITRRASCSCTLSAGHKYKVRCRGIRGTVKGEWSDYSSDVLTIPNAPSKIITLKALSSTSVTIDWADVSICTGYEVQYTTQKRYFDSNPSEVKSQTVESVVGHAEISGLESGSEYFFRVRATNSAGNSSWCGIKSIVMGRKPSAPTTWSSTTTVMVGESLSLYWVHNSEDGSSQTYAELEIIIDGNKTTKTIKNTTDEFNKDKTSVFVLDTSSYGEGAQIKWRVRTKGILPSYGEWSVQRTVDVYAPPTLSLNIKDQNGNDFETLTSFPFILTGLAGPNTQAPIGYHITVEANESYEAVDQIGNTKMISKGDVIYSKYFDITSELTIEFSAGNIDLENNISYTIKGVVSMNSGLRAEGSIEFDVAWTDEEYIPNAEIGYDDETYSVNLRPYCVDEDENLIENVSLSVYRRQYDGEFVEIASGLVNSDNTYVTDPHPALDYARYRIVAISQNTGAVSYYDMPGYPIDEPAVIIQWDEDWSTFDSSSVDEADDTADPVWSGSLVRLPYNVDVSDKTNPDVSLVKYIGRKRPVSYYGTQLGETASWKVEIPKDDVDTLYALRRLAIWMGDVYVREPSGSGYWASVTVSFSQTHKNLTIPVTLEITRVEGGI